MTLLLAYAHMALFTSCFAAFRYDGLIHRCVPLAYWVANLIKQLANYTEDLFLSFPLAISLWPPWILVGGKELYLKPMQEHQAQAMEMGMSSPAALSRGSSRQMPASVLNEAERKLFFGFLAPAW